MLNDTNFNNKIELTAVTKIYEPEKLPAVRHASLSVGDGEFVCIIGPSGSGKSTVLNMIAGLIEPTAGQIKKPDNVSMVFQSGALFPWLTVFDNIAFGLRALGVPSLTVVRQVEELIELMKLSEFKKSFPAQLSGGQGQRVGIARALAVNPAVLLLDEPFSALDEKTTAELHDDLLNIWRKTKKTILMVSHLIEEAISLSDRVILMKNGAIAKTYNISLPYPRREQAADFSRHVLDIRRDFFT